MIQESNVWEEEIHFIDTLLIKDCFNNSAWNQRWFVCHHHHSPSLPPPPAVRDKPVLPWNQVQEEIQYALHYAAIDPSNESPWRYFMGIIKEQWNYYYHRHHLDYDGKIKQDQEEVKVEKDQEDYHDNHTKRISSLLESCISNIRDMQQELVHSGYDALSFIHMTSAFIDLLDLYGQIIIHRFDKDPTTILMIPDWKQQIQECILLLATK